MSTVKRGYKLFIAPIDPPDFVHSGNPHSHKWFNYKTLCSYCDHSSDRLKHYWDLILSYKKGYINFNGLSSELLGTDIKVILQIMGVI